MISFSKLLSIKAICFALCISFSFVTYAEDSKNSNNLKSQIPDLNPTKDFYRWVNNDWLINTPIPSDKPGINNFLAIQKDVNNDIEKILISLKQKQTKSNAEQKIEIINNAFLDMQKRNELGLSPLSSDILQIQNAKTHDDIAILFANLQKKGVASPLSFVVSADFKDSSKNIVIVAQSGLGLERDSYVGIDERSKKQRVDYQEFLQKLFELASIKNAALAAKSVVKLEGEIATSQWSHAENRDFGKTYNIMDYAGLRSRANRLNFDQQMLELGMSTDYPFDVMQPSYVDALNKILLSNEVETWKSYLIGRLLTSYAPLLNQDFRTAYTNYQIKKGLIEKEEPIQQEAISYLNKSVGMLMGKVYIENTFDESIKIKLKEIIKNISNEYRIAINDSPRMASTTKAKALQKLDKMTFKIGYPDEWQDYSALNLTKDELVLNHKSIALYEHKRNMARLGQPVNINDWDHPPQDVNAFYDFTANSFVLLAGILYDPFFNKEGSDAEHYGGIGFVIGHEIGHGFDDQGSKFDANGNLMNWWTPEDSAEFNKVKLSLIDQANHYEILPGKFLKGELEIGEIMGDLSGAEISLRAYQKIIKANNLNSELAYRDYFKQLAKTWRDKLRPDFQLLILDADPHPASEFRANGIVKNFNEFHQVFKTQPGDAMFLSPDKRVKIW
jgi:predicted metalloendopeptidase